MTNWISRASVLRIIDADPVYSDVINEKTYMAEQINNLPTKEETSRPHGKWVQVTDEDGEYLYHKCSNCGQKVESGLDNPPFFNFCMDCGYDMRKEGEEE